MAEKFKVIYTDKGGPYTLHTLDKMVIPVSHRGQGVATMYVGTTEQEVINKIVTSRGKVAVHIYMTAIDKARYIYEFLNVKALAERTLPTSKAIKALDSYFSEEVPLREGQCSVKVYG
jgi:hypothetical protein